MRAVLCLLAFATAARAQPAVDPASFLPLHDGDTWTYRAWSYTASSLVDVVFTEHGHERWTASGVEVDGDSVRARFTVERWGPDGRPAPGAACRITRWLAPVAGVRARLEADAGRCGFPGVAAPEFWTGAGFYRPVELSLGGQATMLGVTNGFPDFRRLIARARDTGADVVSASWTLASGVGLVQSDSTESRGGRTTSYQQSLVHARIDGRDVGPPLDLGGAAGGTVAVVRVAPNPFAARAEITFQTDQPETVAVEVFDALGRLVQSASLAAVPAGTHRHALDGRTLAAGVYIVRLSTARGRSAIQRVVRID